MAPARESSGKIPRRRVSIPPVPVLGCGEYLLYVGTGAGGTVPVGGHGATGTVIVRVVGKP